MCRDKKIIFHIDLNAFFCQCELNVNKRLANVPFAIAPNDNTHRGIVSTSNYIARKYGVFSAMSVRDALRLCPKLRLVSPNFQLYKKYSSLFFSYLKIYSDKIQIASIDECYIDLTDHPMAIKPYELAKKIQTELLNKYKLPTSIGISNTLFLAKMASDLKKPLGITQLFDNDLAILDNLNVSAIYGIGKKTCEKLKDIGIFFIRDFKSPTNEEKIKTIMGDETYYKKIKDLKNRGDDKVTKNEGIAPKSITAETTVSTPTNSLDILNEYLLECYNKAYDELRYYKKMAVSVIVKYKTVDFQSRSKQRVIETPTDDSSILYHEIESLFYDTIDKKEIRLIGCGFAKIVDDIQQKKDLFNYEKIEKKEKLKKTIEKINEKIKGKK